MKSSYGTQSSRVVEASNLDLVFRGRPPFVAANRPNTIPLKSHTVTP